MKLRGAPNLVQSTSPPAEINVNAAYRRTSVIRPEMGATEDTNDWRRMGASMGVLIWAMGLSPKNADDPFREAMALGEPRALRARGVTDCWAKIDSFLSLSDGQSPLRFESSSCPNRAPRKGQ
jgi:hypothetical protein